MNERILELAIQAREYAESKPDIYAVAYDKKFAELLIKKFDDILLLEYLDCVGNQDKQATQRIERLRDKVKTYFGVEE
jgi:hypothetical protein